MSRCTPTGRRRLYLLGGPARVDRTAEVCLAQSPSFLIEGVEWLRETVDAVAAHVDGLVAACFLGRVSFSDQDLTDYSGANPWHLRLPEAELGSVPESVRRWSAELRDECTRSGRPYVDTADHPGAVLLEVARHLGIDLPLPS